MLERVHGWKPATKWGIVLALGVVSGIVVAMLGRIPQSAAYHNFADSRSLLGFANTLDVLSNVLFVVAGLFGVVLVLKRSSALTNDQRWAYGTLFAGLILTGFGSGYYHLAPDNQRLVWDRLPMTIAMAGFITALVVDRFGSRLLWLLPVTLVLGIGSVLQWNWSEQQGHGDLRWYGLYQGLTILIGVALLIFFVSRRIGTCEFVIATIGNVAAKLLEALDKPIYHLGGVVSGHTLKHLSAGLGFLPLVWLIARTKSVKSASAASAPETSSRG